MQKKFIISVGFSLFLALSSQAQNASICIEKYKTNTATEKLQLRSESKVFDISTNDLIQDKLPAIDLGIVNEALQSENEAHIKLNSEIIIAGKLKEIIVDEITGNPVYVQTEGPTRLLNNGKVIQGQNVENHIEGYGTGVGTIASIEFKETNQDTWSLIKNQNPLSSLTSVDVAKKGLVVGKRVRVTYESGLLVEGNIVNIQYLNTGKLGIISFQDASAVYGERKLFQPSFGKYDVAISESVQDLSISKDRANLDHAFNSKKFKTDVTEVKKNALVFYEEVKERFNKQKSIDPEHPYSFPFPESASTFPYMLAETKNRLHLYNSEHGLYWRRKERVLRSIYSAFGRTEALSRQAAGLKAEVELLNLLQADLETIVKRGSPNYDEAIRFSYFFTKAMQMTENIRRAPFRMIPYEYFMNVNYGKAAEELALYKEGIPGLTSNRFKSSVTGKMVFNKDKMEVVVFPVVGFLLASDLFATRNVPVHFATVSSKFAKADGFVLAPLTLYLHDIYFHAGLRETHDRDYFRSRSMNEEDIAKFRVEQQKWIDDFMVELKKVKDQKMRFAIAQAVQTIVHDRGEVLAPSSFNGKSNRNYYYVMKGETYVAAWGQKNFRIDPSFIGILGKMHEAHEWVHQFWLKYKDSPY